MVGGRDDGEAGDMNDTTHPTSSPTGDPAPGSADPMPEPPDPHSGARTEWDHVKDVGKLQRPAERMVAGVAAGLARHLNIDPLVLRVAFAVLSFFGGAGIIVYGALWLLLPEDEQPQAPVPLDERSRGVAVVGVLALAALALIGGSWGLYWFPWPLAVVAVVVWFLWSRRDTHANVQHSPAAAPPATPTAPYAPAYDPAAPYAQPLTRPRDPRRRGPVLFWFTLALITLALGVLGTVDLAGVAVADSAYPALALTISAAMLVLGAFWGRAGGIVLIALLAALGTAGTLAGENWNQGERVFVPESASEVRDSYEMRRGELVLDLTEVADPDALDGRDIQVDGGAGRIELRLPEGLGHDIDATVGVGSIRLPDDGVNGGLGISASANSAPTGDGPRIRIGADLGVGEIVVTQR